MLGAPETPCEHTVIRPLHTTLIAAALILGGTALTAEAQTPKPAGGDPVVARVNSQPITRSEVIEFYSQLPSPMNQIPLEQIRSGIVNELAARKLTGDRKSTRLNSSH